MNRVTTALRPTRRRVLAVLAVLVTLLAVGYGAAWAAVGEEVPRGTTVLGVAIGGMDPEEAERTLEQELAERTEASLPVRVGDGEHQVDPEAAGLDLDAEATVAAAGGGGSAAPRALWRNLFGGTAVEPVVSVDEQALDAAVDRLAEEVDVEPTEGAVTFEGGQVQAVPPEPGYELARERAAEQLRDVYLRAVGPVELPTEPLAPTVTQAEVDRAVEEFARPAMSAPVVLTSGSRRVEVAPRTLAPALSMTPDPQGRLQPVVDPEALGEALAEQIETFGQPPRDARIRLAGGRPQVVPAEVGREVDVPALADALETALASTERREVPVPGAAQQPDLTTEEARALGVREVVGEFTTNYPYAQYRVTNIGRAADIVDGTLLLPGETFSLNETVGERTRENGFVEGTVISGGVFKEELGGGVSQVATTLFNAMFFAGLEDIEHKPHSFYISRYPEGREATVAWPTVDLRFRNDSPYGVLIDTVHEEGESLTVRMWSTKVWDVEATKSERYNVRSPGVQYNPGSDCVPQDGVSGFDVDVYRIFSKGGEEVRREKFTTHYNAADDVYCRAAPTG